jgi:hypothetical protein
MIFYLILFILSSFGLTQILTVGSIFDAIRPKHKFFHCSMCVGFWVGILVFVAFWLCGVQLFTNPYVGAPIFGFISSGTSYILYTMFDDNGISVKLK